MKSAVAESARICFSPDFSLSTCVVILNRAECVVHGVLFLSLPAFYCFFRREDRSVVCVSESSSRLEEVNEKRRARKEKAGASTNEKFQRKVTVSDMENPADEGPSRDDEDINAEVRAVEQVDDQPSCPVKIHEDPRSAVWYKSDRKLALPESHAFIHYISPFPSVSAKNAAMQELFARILEKSLPAELKVATDMEGMNYKLYKSNKGLLVVVNGLNEKVPLLLEVITKCIGRGPNSVTEDLFQVGKEELLKQYSTGFLEPDLLAEMLVQVMTTQNCWSPVHCYAALLPVEFAEFQAYLNKFTEFIYIQSFVQGNLTESEAIQSVQKCVQILNSEVVQLNSVLTVLYTVIPRGVRCCRVQSFDPHNWGSYTTNYYQFEDPSLKLALMIEVFGKIISPNIWQRDYPKTIIGMVDSDPYKIESILSDPTGYLITARCDDDFTVAHVDEKIEDFRTFLNRLFIKTTDDDLLGIKKYIIEEMVKNGAVAGSKEDVSANWNEIITGKYIFDRDAQELDILREMTIKEFRAWMVYLCMGVSDRRLRKLTSQVVGYDEVWDETPEWIRSQERLNTDHSNKHTLTYPLNYLTHVTDAGRRPRSYYITDIERYKRGLQIFPKNV